MEGSGEIVVDVFLIIWLYLSNHFLKLIHTQILAQGATFLPLPWVRMVKVKNMLERQPPKHFEKKKTIWFVC